jgi:hypothetical protein
MATYPYHSLQPLLKFLCSADEYWWLIQNKNIKDKDWISRYASVIPKYTYAQCPICHTECTERIDTYSLAEWGYIPNSDLENTIGNARLYYDRDGYFGAYPCRHFLGVHVFLNLHGLLPREVKDLSIRTGEVPFVTPWLLARQIKAYAVLHALPVCRIEGSEFVPSYTLFCLTYFSEDRDGLRGLIYEDQSKDSPNDPEDYGSLVAFPGDRAVPRQYDLAYWAIRGWLGWLDITQSELPLRIGQGSQLPYIYRDVQGARHEYLWQNGQMYFT